MGNRGKIWGLAAIAIFVFLGNPLGISASINKVPAAVGNLQELQDWYQDNTARPAENCRLTEELVIDRPVTLGAASGRKNIGAIAYNIRIAAGGNLVIDNPLTSIMALGGTIVVEAGGRLELIRGAVYPGTQPPTILVRQGGALIYSGDFLLDAVSISWEGKEENPGEEPDNSIKPPDNDGGEDVSPDTGNSGDGPDSTENPPQSPTPGPVSDLSGRVVSISSIGITMIQLAFSAVPEDVSAVYVHYSNDGMHYKKGTWEKREDDGDFIPCENFQELPGGVAGGEGTTYLVYRTESRADRLWLKLEIEGSVKQGMSNVIVLERKAGAQSNPEDTWEDGSMDGNRGGGGQGTSERVPSAEEPEKDITRSADGQQAEGTLPAAAASSPIQKDAGKTDRESETGGTEERQEHNVSSVLQENNSGHGREASDGGSTIRSGRQGNTTAQPVRSAGVVMASGQETIGIQDMAEDKTGAAVMATAAVVCAGALFLRYRRRGNP